MSITQTDSIDGDCKIFPASYTSEVIDSTITGLIEVANDSMDVSNDACTSILNSVEGKIVMVDIGQCWATPKINHAEEAGAIAMILCTNSIYQDPFTLNLDPYYPRPNIYAGIMSKSDCDKIKVELETNSLNIELNHKDEFCEPEITDLTVWGSNGEGSFDGGLGDWSVEGEYYNQDVTVYSQFGLRFNDFTFRIDSPTSCNGVAVMDFYYLITDNNSNWQNTGQESDIIDAGHLISPSINLSGIDFPQLRFYQYQALYGFDSIFLSYSVDDGINWSEMKQIETLVCISSWIDNLCGTELVEIYIPEIANKDNVRIRFSALNQFFYGWILDDVTIEGLETDPVSKVQDAQVVSEILLFPNPASKQINIDLDSFEGEIFTLQLFDQLGQKRSNDILIKSKKHSIDIGFLYPGLYFFMIESEGRKYCKKFIVK